MTKLDQIDIDKVAASIEADAGETLPGLRQSLAEAKAGLYTLAPSAPNKPGPGRPLGSRQETRKEAIKIRLDADIVAALRASGNGWQTRINDTLRASLALSGVLEEKKPGKV